MQHCDGVGDKMHGDRLRWEMCQQIVGLGRVKVKVKSTMLHKRA